MEPIRSGKTTVYSNVTIKESSVDLWMFFFSKPTNYPPTGTVIYYVIAQATRHALFTVTNVEPDNLFMATHWSPQIRGIVCNPE